MSFIDATSLRPLKVVADTANSRLLAWRIAGLNRFDANACALAAQAVRPGGRQRALGGVLRDIRNWNADSTRKFNFWTCVTSHLCL